MTHCIMTSRSFLRILVFLTFLGTNQLTAQSVIRSVTFEGNQFLSQRRITDVLPARIGSVFSPAGINQYSSDLTSLYHREGFYAFRIDSVVTVYDDDSASVSITFHLREGVRTVVQSIVLSGNNVLTESEILQGFETETGAPLDGELLESDIRSLLENYSQKGFPFARIRADSVVIDPEDERNLTLHIVITEGAGLMLDEISVEGNTVTSAQLIIREARLQKGEMFSDEKSERIRRRLERMQIFSSVSEPQLYVLSPADSAVLRGGLLVTVKEGNSNSFDGILGYVPAAPPNTGGYFTGDLFVAFRNLFGTGRKAMVKWKRENELTQEFEIQYREPWVLGFPVTLGGTFFQRKQDSTYVKTRFDLRGEYAVTEELTVAGNLTTESVYPAADLQQFTIFESNTIAAGAEILYDTRDNFRNPTHGVRYSTSARQGSKEITGPQKFALLITRKYYAVQQYSIDAETYISTFTRQVLVIALHGRKISSTGLEVSDLYQFGGTNSVRGYRENQFLASSLAWTNLEYRFLTGRASSLFGFADGGYFSRPADINRGIGMQEKGVYGYGIGARVETGLGILNISFALGEGDSFGTGKIHVGIENEF
ncbi:MAG: BamA/OMP85 family outer membrane protein [Bacteroidota bacterium]